MYLYIELSTETQSKLVQLQSHINKNHDVFVLLDSLASDVLKSALSVYAPKAYCVRCQK